jgi:hypothetical protein
VRAARELNLVGFRVGRGSRPVNFEGFGHVCYRNKVGASLLMRYLAASGFGYVQSEVHRFLLEVAKLRADIGIKRRCQNWKR